jgi:hypothetical protein
VSNAAVDFDSPAQTLAYSFPLAPAGATINATSGTVSWRPTVSQSGSNYPITVRVSDNGAPSMSATQSFAVAVLAPAKPSVSQQTVGGGGFHMTIDGDSGPDYSVYVTTNLALDFTSWTWLLTTNPISLPFQFMDPTATNYARRFYRVLLGP